LSAFFCLEQELGKLKNVFKKKNIDFTLSKRSSDVELPKSLKMTINLRSLFGDGQKNNGYLVFVEGISSQHHPK
jgi:hypothetical protein